MEGIRYLGPLESWGERRAGEAGAVTPTPGYGGGRSQDRRERPLPRRAAAAYAAARPAQNPEPLLTAEQAMQAPAVTVDESAALREVEALFRARDISHLPVLGAEGTLIGLVSERDILRLHARPPRHLPGDFGDSPVREHMISPALAVGPDTDIRQAAWLMVEKKSDCLPVVDAGGKVLGVITRTDILRGLAKHPTLRLWA